MENSVNLLEEINSLSKIHTLKRDDIDAIMIEFAKRILSAFHIERMSVWLFTPEKNAIISMGEYDLPKKAFSKNNILPQHKYPTYFKAVSENEILLAPNIYTNQFTKELSDEYSKPNNIISLMDIPLRIEGELVGVMCYEKTGDKERVFTKNEQIFAMSIALVFASNLEARQRRALQHRLNEELHEKTILIKEIHHRVKNNLSVVSGLMALQSGKSKDSFHMNLFEECRNKINAISSIHELVYKTESFSKINLKDYIGKLLTELEEFYTNDKFQIQLDASIEAIELELEKVVPLSLLINEVITNSYKHAFTEAGSGIIKIRLKQSGKIISLSIQDNGKGFGDNNIKSDSLGMEIINGLSDQLCAEYSYKGDNGTLFTLVFENEVQ